MGQFALGIRSLLVKLAVFVLLASLLAWALGGTLFPRPETASRPSVSFAGREYFWQLAVGGKNKGEMAWRMMARQKPDEKAKPIDAAAWDDAAGPIVVADRLYYGGLDQQSEAAAGWTIHMVGSDGRQASFPMPDRLAVEQQLARLQSGLSLQDARMILEQRSEVLDPAGGRLPAATQPIEQSGR